MVISNGVNGSYSADNEEYMDTSDNMSKTVPKDIVTEEDEVDDDDEDGDEEEDDEDDHETIADDQQMEKYEHSERVEAVGSSSKKGEMFETENDFNVSKSSDGVSETNDSSEVSKTKAGCTTASYEAMEVDEQSNNSDVECLDESVTEIQLDNDDVFISKGTSEKRDSNDMSSGSDMQLNDSLEIADSSMEMSDVKLCEENGSCGSPDIEEITDGARNSQSASVERASKDPTKQRKPRKQIDLSSITPRRSSRNIKRTSYIEKEVEEEVDDDGSDIEEIKPEDPLGGIDSKDKENSKLKSPTKNSKTIVVNDTKRLVEIAAGSKSVKGGKKEPTLVIIDTNSILSGRGGVPVSNSKPPHHSVSNSSSFSVVPMGMGTTQTMYPNMRTTITPVPMTSKTAQLSPKTSSSMTTVTPTVPQILPTLTDDMFVVEAPSFIVPYVYEKPPLRPLKEFVAKLEKTIEEREKERKKIADESKDDEERREDPFDASKKDNEKIEESECEGRSKKDGDDRAGDNSIDLTEHGFSSIGDRHELRQEERHKMPTYFEQPLGKFFMQIGTSLVQEFVQTDLLRTQKRKQGKGSTSAETQLAINSLIKNLEFSKENNEPFHLDMKKCEFCNFKTESILVMQHHLETPHMRNYVYKCNFCPIEVRSPHDILYHMEAEHNTRGRLERGPAFHQCPNCPFEDNQKGKLTRHILACTKKFRPERNLEPAPDWEPPAKIPRLNRARPVGPTNPSALAMAMSAKGAQPLLPKLLPAPIPGRGRGRPPMQPRYSDLKTLRPGSTTMRQGKATFYPRLKKRIWRKDNSKSNARFFIVDNFLRVARLLFVPSTVY